MKTKNGVLLTSAQEDWRLKTEGGSVRKYSKISVKDSSLSVKAYVNRL